MMMDIRDTSCCGVAEISGLQYHGTPKKCMRDFCEAYTDGDDYYNYYRNGTKTNGEMRKLDGFIIFTEVSGFKGKKSAGVKTGYGKAFAKYIKDNNFGTVVVSMAGNNRVNHPSHLIKVYTWRPNERAIRAWAKKEKLF